MEYYVDPQILQFIIGYFALVTDFGNDCKIVFQHDSLLGAAISVGSWEGGDLYRAAISIGKQHVAVYVMFHYVVKRSNVDISVSIGRLI